MAPGRRDLLKALLAALGASTVGCSSTPEGRRPAPPPPPPPLRIARLSDLLPAAGSNWVVVVRPAELMALPWLRRPLSRILRDERLDLLAATTGVDLRRATELALASYGQQQAVLYLVRHHRGRLAIERLFRQRLTGAEQRAVDADARVVRVSGRIGRLERVFVGLGDEVAGFQYGGDPERGPARVAALYATGQVRKSATIAADPTLGPAWQMLGDAPARGLLPGPFDEATGRGARGLLAAATALGATATPTAEEALALTFVIVGDFTSDAARARELALAAWSDLAASDLGHLLGLHEPRVAPAADVDERRIRLVTVLDPAALFAGLAAATTDDIRQIMR